jgi:hypothetical protein
MSGPARIAIVLLAVALFASCAKDDGPPPDPRDVIELRWVKAYPRESRSDVETGLLWGLSLLGAKLPEGARVLAGRAIVSPWTWRAPRWSKAPCRRGGSSSPR